jgi:hypothetical protein
MHKLALQQFYHETVELFQAGRYDEAFERFRSIYLEDVGCGDVARIVQDYYDMAKDEWIAKYVIRFQE